MLDRWTSRIISLPLGKLAHLFRNRGIEADRVTIVGFGIGMLAVPLLAMQWYPVALVVIVINRIFDGVDGVLAREKGATDSGGFLDISLDFIFYAAVPFGFALADPQQNALAAAALIFSFVGTGSSFLAFAALAGKRGLDNPEYPSKSLYYLGGLTEGTETIIVLVLFCLFPAAFPVLAVIFAIACWVTTITRVWGGYLTLRKDRVQVSGDSRGQGRGVSGE